MFFESIIKASLTVETAAICFASSIILGIIIAFAYKYKSEYTSNFLISIKWG